MGGLAQVIGSMLSWLHLYPINLCPGTWPWTITLAGALLAASPVFGAILVALIRKGTGNQYDTPVLIVFGGIGVLFGFLVPWLATTVVSNVVNEAATNGTALGLTRSDIHGLNQATTCGLSQFGSQGDYLGHGHTVYEALIRSTGGGFGIAVYVTTLIGVPVLCLLTVMVQQRIALRRGPRWPGRLMWLPVLAFMVATVPLEANLMAHFWIGFLVASIAGVVLLSMLGAPSWGVINRAPKPKPAASPPPPRPQQTPYPESSLAAYPPGLYQKPGDLYRKVPDPEPYRPQHNTPLPRTLVENAPPPVRPSTGAGQLAATPGPLPFGPRETTAVLWNSANGRFRRVRQLGHGGFGTVWLAKDTQLDRTVALKFAHAPDPDTQARMLREARALAAVHHPNCVRVYDIIEDVDGLGIVMEYIDGQMLQEAVAAHGPLDDVAAARLWATMAGALAAAHEQGVLHRDVKPANILVDHNGLPHLIDFGIARTKGDATLTAVGMMMGTPDFLAPETAASGTATPASDAWQVAATVSYGLTGQPPRGHRSNPMSALMAAAQRLPNTHLPDRSRHLNLLRQALDPEPARRPTLTTVHRELTRWLAGAGHTEQGPVTVVTTAASRQGH
ncbi:MAG TPA: serine/threonine-protein kinase [Pseudonocardiaceae bacterium]|nr:serine/threonine-protein kinase [Pseudonocardiaceae bacterium]